MDSTVSSKAFLAGEDYELVVGVAKPVEDRTEAHEQIGADIGANLKLAMDG